MKYDLDRFVKAQEQAYETALKEIEGGRKSSHWMWYIFPQLKELGRSGTAKYYGIENLEEAKAFLEDDFLGGNLMEITSAVLGLKTNDMEAVFGYPDCMKLRSCMTLFGAADPDCEVFFRVLDKCYDGQPCERTLKILGME